MTRRRKHTTRGAMYTARPLRVAVIGVCLFGLVSCRTVSPVDTLDHPEWVRGLDADFLLSPMGEVLYINREHDYMIIRTAVLPAVDEELNLYRKGDRVGRVRVTDRRYPPFLAADILEGEPEQGDTVRR